MFETWLTIYNLQIKTNKYQNETDVRRCRNGDGPPSSKLALTAISDDTGLAGGAAWSIDATADRVHGRPSQPVLLRGLWQAGSLDL